MGIIILASKSVLTVVFCKIFGAKPEKITFDAYRWEGYKGINMSTDGQISISVISSIDMQH